MKTAVITGSCGLIGLAATRRCLSEGFQVIGIDNDARAEFFGQEASTKGKEIRHENYHHEITNVASFPYLADVFETYKDEIELVIHCAAQPSHDLAARMPLVDFHTNAVGTLNVAECVRTYCPEAVVIHLSTSKVYGTHPNDLPFKETATRVDLPIDHPYWHGIPESFPVDQTLHSLFGVSKLSGDLVMQEYGRYFGIRTHIFRPGCLTGPDHQGVALHGWLSYLMQCAIENRMYTIFGYEGKQVRDNIHADDLVDAFMHVYRNPRPGGEVYNLGGGRACNVSMMEAIAIADGLTGNKMRTAYDPVPRIGDHRWFIGSDGKFLAHYPEWSRKHSIQSIMEDIYRAKR